MRILNSSLIWEGREELNVGGGEWGKFLGGDWFLGGGDEKFEDGGFFVESDVFLGGVSGGWVKFLIIVTNCLFKYLFE